MKKQVITLLQQVVSESNDSQAYLANFLLNCDQQIKKLKINDIAGELFISPATGTRLAKRIGLTGFSELKVLLDKEKNEIQNQIIEYDSENTAEGIKKYYQKIKDSLVRTIQNVNEQEISSIAKKIEKSNRVDIYAIGGTNLQGMDFAYKLARIDKRVTNYNDPHLQFFQAKNSDKNTVSIGISYSGENKEVLRALKLANEKNAITILLTHSEKAFAQIKYLNFIVKIKSLENPSRNFSIACRFSTLVVLDLIYLKIITDNPRKYDKILKETKFYYLS